MATKNLIEKYCNGKGLEISSEKSHYTKNPDTLHIDKAYVPGKEDRFVSSYADTIQFKDNRFDFIMSSHWLEHCPDTIKVLEEWKRVLSKEGVLFLVLPHGERTFDRGRKLTTLEHHIEDQKRNVNNSDSTHWEEFAKISIPGHPHSWLNKARNADGSLNFEWIVANGHLHYHVWTQNEIIKILKHLGWSIITCIEELEERKDSFVVIAKISPKIAEAPKENIPVIKSKQGDGRVAIIILAWNQLKFTKICIESIKKETNRDRYDLIVVDQGSTDETVDYLKTALDGKGDLIIHNTKNIGFSGGNNQGVQIAKCEYLLLLNNDCKINKNTWLDILINTSKEDGIGLCGALCQKGKPNHTTKMFEHIGAGKVTDEWSYIEGWCLFLKRDLFMKLDGFDMKFNPAYGEDSDLSFRIKQMGWKLKAVSLPIKHFGSKSKGQLDSSDPNQGNVSGRYMYRKWIQGETKVNIPGQTVETHKKVKILFRRRGAMGDVLLTTPTIRALKEKYPQSFIVYETDCPDVLKDNPFINSIGRSIPNVQDFDMVFTPRYEVDMAKVAMETMAKQCDIKLSNTKLDLYLTEENIRWAKSCLDSKIKYIAFHTGRAWKSKEWMIERFAEVARYYRTKGYGILEVGNKQTQLTGVGKDCRGCSVRQTAALIKECQISIGIDSGCAHLAKAVGTPACVIYGSVDPSTASSDAVEYPIRIEDLECKGCRGRTDMEWVDCDKPEVYCLTRITPDIVIETMNECILREAKNQKEEIIGSKYFAAKQKSAPEVEIQLEEIAEKKRMKQGRRRIYKKENPQSVDTHKIF